MVGVGLSDSDGAGISGVPEWHDGTGASPDRIEWRNCGDKGLRDGVTCGGREEVERKCNFLDSPSFNLIRALRVEFCGGAMSK
ncbi:hypothetical protein U1Q18_039206, partial [Sarracenia purpurea var. burkii]